MKTTLLSLFALLLAAPLLRAEPVLDVATSIPPHVYLIHRIGEDRVTGRALIVPGQNPHTFEPNPRQIADLAKCRLYFSLDMPFEDKLVEKLKALAPDMKVIDLQDGLATRKFTGDELEAHEAAEGHGHDDHDHDHDHGKKKPAHAHDESTDPHTWLNPRLAKAQAERIAQGLAVADPAGAEIYNANYAKLAAELDALDKDLAESLAPLKGKALLVYHPAFGYFADAYGLRQVAVETGGKEPSAKQLRSLIKRAKQEGVRVVFVQPQFALASAQALAQQINGSVVPLDDLSPNYIENLREVAARVRQNVGE